MVERTINLALRLINILKGTVIAYIFDYYYIEDDTVPLPLRLGNMTESQVKATTDALSLVCTFKSRRAKTCRPKHMASAAWIQQSVKAIQL